MEVGGGISSRKAFNGSQIVHWEKKLLGGNRDVNYKIRDIKFLLGKIEFLLKISVE